MNEITELINNTLENLNKKNKLITPTNYEKEFFSLFEQTDLILEDYVEFEEIIKELAEDEKKYLKKNNINSFKELAILLSNRINESEIKHFLQQLSFFMSPSLNNDDIQKDLDELCKDIATNPSNLINNETKRKLRNLTNRRIDTDKQLFTDKTSDVKKLILFLGEYFKKSLCDNKTTIDEVHALKDEIKSLELSSSSEKDLQILQDKLLEATLTFEKAVTKNNNLIEDSQAKCEVLYEQIEELQVSLTKAEKEKSIDFLTGVLTRRAFDMEANKIENEYNVYDSNYALVFFDIDHFKNINDNYGHTCGDSVLKTFASILKKLTRTEDVIVRFGGEEFVTIVHYKNKIEINNYLKRIKNIITSNKFVCKNAKLKVEFCAGVSFRKNYKSYEEALNKADNLLYEAKQSGRNKIILDSGDIF